MLNLQVIVSPFQLGVTSLQLNLSSYQLDANRFRCQLRPAMDVVLSNHLDASPSPWAMPVRYTWILPVLVASWAIWRLWSFTIYPLWHPDEPKTYPYVVPFVGHGISFFRDVETTVTRARIYFGNSREPFKLIIMGQVIYVMTSAHDPAGIYNTDSFSMNPWLVEMMSQFGASPSSVKAMWSVVPLENGHNPISPQVPLRGWEDKPVKEVCLMLFRLLLVQGAQMEKVLRMLLDTVIARMSWNAIPKDIVLQGTEDSYTISLSKWCQHALLEGATQSFFGHALLDLEPNLLRSFTDFDEASWKLSYQLPEFLAKDCLESKAIAENALAKYFELPREQRADASLVMQEIESVLRTAGINSKDMGVLVLMFYWVINANVWKASFWMLTEIINDEDLRLKICKEIEPLISPAGAKTHDSLELSAQLLRCPTLMAAYHEAIRVSSSSMTIRLVMEDTEFRGFKFQKGGQIIIPYRQVMLDDSVFGEDPYTFKHERFLNNPSLLKSAHYKPFGGGITLCPGRVLAQKEVLTFVALALGKFQVQMPQDKELNSRRMPKMDTRTPCLGVMGPVSGEDIAVTIRRPQW
jgi:hypothetical protein